MVLRIVITPDPPKTPASPLTYRGGLDLEEVPSSPPPFLSFGDTKQGVVPLRSWCSEPD